MSSKSLARSLSLSLALLSALFVGKAFAMQFPMELIETIDDSRIVAFIHEVDIAASKVWEPSQGSVPLSIDGALKAVLESFRSDEDKDLIMYEIKLKRIPHHGGHWNYLVVMKSATNHRAAEQYYVVLMSGKVVAAIREPSSYK